MLYRFEQDERLDPEKIEVVVRSAEKSAEVGALLAYLKSFQTDRPEVLPVRDIDRIVLVEVSQLILIEVDGDYLILSTKTGQLPTRSRLYQLAERLNNPDFIQISKYALVNIKWVKHLENSFSGNMTAFLKNGQQATVSRRYLKGLSTYLGL